uniref:Uncharacterized protein n=1 Tax=Cannabis sativa TaxID=3483 RepID=A0A803QYI8_CANSA
MVMIVVGRMGLTWLRIHRLLCLSSTRGDVNFLKIINLLVELVLKTSFPSIKFNYSPLLSHLFLCSCCLVLSE